MYIYEDKNFPHFTWDKTHILTILAKVKLEQGLLLGKMQNLGFNVKDSALLQTITEEILKSSQIEGEILDVRAVRSSIARKFGLDANDAAAKSSRSIDGFVDMMYDAIHNYKEDVTKARLCNWHTQMFPEKKSGLYKIETGKYRNDKLGPMQVVSGPMGMEKVHYQAPDARVVNAEMEKLFKFINTDNTDNIIKAAITHLWFVIIHPFDDGNGRIARALTEMLLARSENSSDRFYSMSSQIEKHRKAYYEELKITQGGSLDITSWLEWFLNTLLGAIENSQDTLKTILGKSTFWNIHQGETFNDRQSKMLNMLFDGFNGHLTSSKWAIICKVSHDTATRDIADLVKHSILEKVGDGRTTYYILKQGELK